MKGIITVIPFVPEFPPIWRPESPTMHVQDGGEPVDYDTARRVDHYLLASQARRGFPRTVNAGIEEAYRLGYRYALIWNSDAKIVDGTVDDLMKSFLDPYVGIVAPAKVYEPDVEGPAMIEQLKDAIAGKFPESAGRIVLPKDPVWERTSLHMDGPMALLMERGERYMCEGFDYCPLYAVKIEPFIGLGGFDTMFSPGFFEDADLWRRFRLNGWKTMVDGRVVYQHGDKDGVSKSFNVIYGEQKKMEIGQRNLALFWTKWGILPPPAIPNTMSPHDPIRATVQR